MAHLQALCLQYDLWCKMRFFGQDIELAESAASNVKRGNYHPIRITSGYRCPELNRAVGGVKNSQHMRGEAADIHLPSVDKGLEYLSFLKTLPAVDELIWERNGNVCWIHVSARRVK